METGSRELRKGNLSQVRVTATRGIQPFSRVKSSSTVTKDGKLFLFGGFDEDDNLDGNVYILDISTLTWQTHKHHLYREGHSALAITNNDVLVYGGISEDYNAANALFIHDDLMLYNTITHEWRPATVAGMMPTSRTRHAACLSTDGTKMFVSGGQEHEEGTPLDDLYCYDITTGVWDGPRKFIGRFDHFITFHDDRIWAFGGLTNEMAHATEISFFDLVTNTTGSVAMHDLPKLEGDHIYMPTMNDSLVLDVVVPLWTFEKVEPCIGLYDLKSLRWQAVLMGTFRPLLGYRWRHTVVHDGKLLLIGYPLNSATNDNSFDYKLSDVVQLDLGDLGIYETMNNSESQGGVISDLSKLLFQEQFSDFNIIGVEGDERPSFNSKFIENTGSLDTPFSLSNDDTFIKSKPIPVHSIILLARWPHFHRIVQSGMTETHTNTLFIQEPVDWIMALIEYLYTDSIRNKDTDTLTGLLILGNVYDLPRLRSMCIQAIYSQGFKITNVLKIWSRANLVGEQVLAHNASTFCFYNWGKVVKTKNFRELSKEEIVTLCQEVEQDSVIVNNKQNVIIHGVHEGLQLQQRQQQLQTQQPHSQQLLHHHNGHDTLTTYNTGGIDRSSFTVNSPNSINRYQTSGFRSITSLNNLGVPKDNEDDDNQDPSFDSDADHGTAHANNMGSRFTTPQASVYLGNPQMGMNSLGERPGDDTDMEDE